MRYPSKVDTWIAVMIAIGPLTVLALAIFLHVMVVWIAFAAVALIMLLLVWPCDYTLNDQQLIVRCGLIRFRIDYRDISNVQESRSMLSSPALSLDRIAITTNRYTMMVSPVKKEQFMAELNQHIASARG